MIYEELARDLESDTEVTISVTCRISSNTRLDLGVDFTILEVKKHPKKEGNDVPLVRDLASDRHHEFRDLSYFVSYKSYRLDLDIDFTIFGNEEGNDVLVRDLASDWGHTFRG